MLKTTGSLDLAPRELGTNEVVGGGGRADETVVDSSKSSKSRRIVKKSEKPQRPEKFAKVIGSEESSFLTSDTRLAFTKMGSRYTELTAVSSWLLLKPLIIKSTT